MISESLRVKDCSHGRPLLLFITIWLPSCSLQSSSCPASATPEQRSSLIRAKYPITRRRGRKLNVVMIHGFSSSVRSHAVNVLLWDRTARERKGPQSLSTMIVSAAKLILSKFCSAGLDIASDVGYLLSCG